VTYKEIAVTDKELFTKIVNHATKNERIAWKRKHKKMTTMIEENIQPIEEKILELTMERQVHLDELIALRDLLAKECVHPREFLVNRGDYVLCKFCNKRLTVNEQD
jgi:hypothetical protein